ERYKPYVDLADSVDVKTLVQIYVHFYPRFQSAYRELGMPGYFNDRVVEVLDALLATPKAKAEIKLVRPTPHSKYKFADDDLEDLASGQKILLRMGETNEHIVKAKLRRIRGMLVHWAKKQKHAQT